MSFTDEQKEALKWSLSPISPEVARVLLWEGDIRSGKSWGLVSAQVAGSLQHTGENFILAGRTVGALERNIVPHLRDVCRKAGLTIDWNGNTAKIGGNSWHMFGGNNKRAIEPLFGFEAAGALIDEATLLDQEFMELIISRCSVDGAKIGTTMNPNSPHHWIKKDLIDNPDYQALHLVSDIRDNPGISEETIEFFEKTLTGHRKERWLRKQWTEATGLIWPGLPQFNGDRIENPETIAGVDYGSSNPTAVEFLSHVAWTPRREKIWDVVAEYYSVGEDRSVEEHVAEIKRMGDELRCSKYFVDPSAGELKRIMRRHGLTVIDANNDVADGIVAVEDMIVTGRLTLSPDVAPELEREIALWSWDPVQQLKGKDVPIDKDDHTCDCLRYAVNTYAKSNFDVVVMPRGFN